MTRLKTSWQLITGAVLIFVLVGIGSFVLVREEREGGSVEADEPAASGRGDFWYRDIAAEWEAASRAERTVAGVLLGDGELPISLAACDSDDRDWGDPESMYGSFLDPRPAYLPNGTLVDFSVEGMTCAGTPVWIEVTYYVPGGREWDGRFGGDFSVFRFVGERQFGLDYPTGRIVETTVGDSSAALSPPLSSDGYGQSAVVVNEPWGLTIVRAKGITQDELLRIAGSLGGAR